jgi:hypothetical protein
MPCATSDGGPLPPSKATPTDRAVVPELEPALILPSSPSGQPPRCVCSRRPDLARRQARWPAAFRPGGRPRRRRWPRQRLLGREGRRRAAGPDRRLRLRAVSAVPDQDCLIAAGGHCFQDGPHHWHPCMGLAGPCRPLAGAEIAVTSAATQKRESCQKGDLAAAPFVGETLPCQEATCSSSSLVQHSKSVEAPGLCSSAQRYLSSDERAKERKKSQMQAASPG